MMMNLLKSMESLLLSNRGVTLFILVSTLCYMGCAPSAMVVGKGGSKRVINKVSTKEDRAIPFRSDSGNRLLNFKKISKITLLSDSTAVFAGETWLRVIVEDKKVKFGDLADTGWIRVDQQLLGSSGKGDYSVYLKDLQEVDFNYKKSGKASSAEAPPAE